jgi:predicted O-methyltransferase YrrM
MIAGFTEAWFDEQSQQVLAGLARSVADVPGLIVEIGAWEGRSTCALANAVHPRLVHSVDTWHGSPGEISADLAAHRDVFARWQANTTTFTRGNVQAHRMGWREFVPTITDPVALVFIDAEHTFVEVRDNIKAMLPLMSSGGVICGDDAHHPPVLTAALEVLGEVTRSAALWVYRMP